VHSYRLDGGLRRSREVREGRRAASLSGPGRRRAARVAAGRPGPPERAGQPVWVPLSRLAGTAWLFLSALNN